MTHSEIFTRLLDETAAIITHPGTLALPADELHTEILIPLLPAMLRDHAIRDAWRDHIGHGFFGKIQTDCGTDAPTPRWEPGDFEIQAAASYLAGPDAQALADTLRSEDSLRDLTAALMNQILEILWPALLPPEPADTGTVPGITTIIPPLVAPAPEHAEICATRRATVLPRPFRAPIHSQPRWLRTGTFTMRPWSSSNLVCATRASCTRAFPINRGSQ